MRLQIISDLHVDINVGYAARQARGIDAVVVAGDVCEGFDRAFAYLRSRFPAPLPIVMVAGNHEFYHDSIAGGRRRALEQAALHDITFLDDDIAVIAGVRFVGATLWSDFAFFGPESKDHCMAVTRRAMADFSVIRVADGGAVLTPDDVVEQHAASRCFLESALAEPFDGPTVVVTHHGPHGLSVAPQYREDPVTAAFVSDLGPLFELACRPRLWVHGHTHTSFDYRLRSTRVVCNPLSYGGENPAFEEVLVVEV